MKAKVTCHIKGKAIVFYREDVRDDTGFHSVRVELCSTLPGIAEQAKAPERGLGNR
jgi:hypothetical protein